MALTHFISLKEAAQKMRVSTAQIRDLVESGKIEGGILPDGEVVVNEESLPVKKEDLPEYKKYAHLKGRAIWLNKASKDYNIPQQTITRWVKSNIIERLFDDGYRVFVNEQDVAYCAEIYHKFGSQGRRLFNPDGTPYKRSLAG
jgi:predicted site-specific integrase-resolvase